MTKYIFHTVKSLERWDNIAYQYYGNPYKIQPLIDANPHVQISGILKEGTEIKIPIDDEVKIDNSMLPVWRQQ